MNVDLRPEKLVKLIKSRIINPENNYVRLNGLIENAQLEKIILNISTFEQISFHINRDQVDDSLPPTFERLSLVRPPSFECVFPIQLAGHFMVKYPSSSVALPVKLSAFWIEYVAILVEKKDTYHFKNEHIRLPVEK